MKDRSLSSIESVVSAHLCTGCGACAYLQPDRLTMRDLGDVGRRPLPLVGITGGTRGPGVMACPGRSVSHPPRALDGAPFNGEWGPILSLYECWSTDPELRHRGSSGGVVSALAAHAVRSARAHGVLQVRASESDPLANDVVLNTSYAEISNSAGSRYAPASPCERLDLVEQAPGPCVVVGKPCDIVATARAARLRPALEQKVDLTIAIFCAGTPTTGATKSLINKLGMEPRDVQRVDYRGEGWPGRFRATDVEGRTVSTTYSEAWGWLTRQRQWRCLICPDHTGEFADLSVGDPWYRKIDNSEAGRSLVIVRTERGREALLAAFADDELDGVELSLDRLPQSQPSLESTRGAVWGRVMTMRVLGLPAPRFRGLPSFRLWWRLPSSAKASSTLGTWRRARLRRLWQSEPSS